MIIILIILRYLEYFEVVLNILWFFLDVFGMFSLVCMFDFICGWMIL